MLSKISILDITKSLALIGLIGFLWFHGSNFINSFGNNNANNEILSKLSQNEIVLRNLVASNSGAKEFIKRLNAENGQQADLLLKVKQDNKSNDSKIDEVGVVIGKLKQQVNLLEKKSDHVYKPTNTNLQEQEFYFKKIYSTDEDGKKFPIAWVQFFPKKSDGDRWVTGNYPIEYHVTLVETESDDGNLNRYAEMHVENNQMKETKGEEYKVNLTNLEWEKFEKKDKKFHLWNPRLGLGASFTDKSIAPGLDLSISSYGRTKRDLDWRFIVFGIGITDDEDGVDGILSVEPVSWNFGNVLPLVENMFIGPAVTMDTELNYGVGLKLSIPF